MAYRFDSIDVSHAVAEKLGSKHGVSIEQVEEVFETGSLQARWNSERGCLLVRGHTESGRGLNIVLYPIEGTDGGWRLATAYPA